MVRIRAHRTRFIRPIVLKLLRRLNPGTIKIRHHWTGDPVYLDCFRHRNYWWHGKRRERDWMTWFGRTLRPGDHVLELGGHIGYVTMYLASLVGESGRVIVYEPTPESLRYLRRNVARLPQVGIRERAAGDVSGSLPMFVESLSGQNNSLVHEFPHLANNVHFSGIQPKMSTVQVPVVRVDDDVAPDAHFDLVKIDVEGFEYEALAGMVRLIERCRPTLLVELNAVRNAAVAELLGSAGYVGFDEDGRTLEAIPKHLVAMTVWRHRSCDA